VTINAQRDVCGVQKAGGQAISAPQLLRCMRVAAAQAVKLTDQLRAVVAAHAAARLSGRVRRHRPAAAAPPSFLLGGQLPGEPLAGADAMDADGAAYLAEPDEEEEEEEAAQGAGSERADWDMLEPAGGSFPFTGPLHPGAARGGAGDDADADAQAAPARRPAGAVRLSAHAVCRVPCVRPDTCAASLSGCCYEGRCC
jgi:hypothetical protein